MKTILKKDLTSLHNSLFPGSVKPVLVSNGRLRAVLPALTGVILFLSGCGSQSAHVSDKAVDTRFCLPVALQGSVRIDTVKNEMVERELNLTGKVTFNEDQVVKVYPLVSGIVEDLKVELGDYVKKGQVLAVMRSSEIAEYDQQLVAAESNLNIAEKNLDVAEDMYKSGLTSEKEVVTARKEAQKAVGELRRIKEVLQIYGVGKNALYTIKAPISGFIVEKNATENTQLRADNGSNLFTISAIDKVWVIANVYESDIAKVSLGDDASITTLSYPDRVFKGKVDKVYNVLEPGSKSMKIRIVMDNKDYMLKPEMFASVTVRSKGNPMSAIPAQAVVFDKSKNFVVVYKDNCDLVTREVNVLKSLNGTTYVINGLKEGEKVVSKSQLLVYNALNQ